jgi:hypothetical protein
MTAQTACWCAQVYVFPPSCLPGLMTREMCWNLRATPDLLPLVQMCSPGP